MIKEINLEKLSESEKNLFERIKNANSTSPSVIVRDAVDPFEKRVFFTDIFRVVVEDVFEVLSIDDWNKKNYNKVFACARYLMYDDYEGFCYPSFSLFDAFVIVWISCCTNYKNNGPVYTLPNSLRGLRTNKKNVQLGMCSQFFNSFTPLPAKAAMFEQYMLLTYGNKCRDNKYTIETPEQNFKSLMTLLNLTGFSYEGPCKQFEFTQEQMEQVKPRTF